MSSKSDTVAQLCAKIEEGGGRSAALAHKLRAWSEGEIIELELVVVFEIAVRHQAEVMHIRTRTAKTSFGMVRLVDNERAALDASKRESAALGTVSAALDLADCMIKSSRRNP